MLPSPYVIGLASQERIGPGDHAPLQQTAVAGGGDGFGAVLGAELAEDRADVEFYRALADRELVADLLVGVADGDEAEHLALAAGERAVLLHAAEQLRGDHRLDQRAAGMDGAD